MTVSDSEYLVSHIWEYIDKKIKKLAKYLAAEIVVKLEKK
jgi:hypothetical protein